MREKEKVSERSMREGRMRLSDERREDLLMLVKKLGAEVATVMLQHIKAERGRTKREKEIVA